MTLPAATAMTCVISDMSDMIPKASQMQQPKQ